MSLISSQETISQLIPQQAPFVLVDNILEHEETAIVSGFRIPENHVLVSSDGFLTEAGVIENFAQTIALYQGYDYFKRNLPAPVGYIGSIKNFEIYALPRSGDDLRTSVYILQRLFGVTAVRGEVKIGDKIIAVGEMRTVIAKEVE